MSSPPFEEFCTKLFDRLANVSGVTKKKQIFEKYLQYWRSNYEPDFYDAMQLLLPKFDKKSYRLKEDTIANLILKALAIDPKSPDGQHLKNYKQPTKISKIIGDFHLVAMEKIKQRSTVMSSSMTVKDTSNILTKLAAKGEDQTKTFKEIINKYTPHQVQWILRIILQDLKIGISEMPILEIYHPRAKEAYIAGKPLDYICHKLGNITYTASNQQEFSIFYPCMPQSGKRINSADMDKLFNELPKPFYVETKLDGERMIMHFDRRLDKFLWHTRKKTIQNHLYGGSISDGKLTSMIEQGLPPLNNIILDGEMIGYNEKEEMFLPFGSLKTTAIGSRKDLLNSTEHPCYIVFDILFYKDQPTIGHSLEARQELLRTVVKDQGNFLRVLPQKKMYSKEEVMEELTQKILMREEGLLIKNPKAKYVLNSKVTSWLKIKPEYMDTLIDTCDLIVIGAKYGDGYKRGKLSIVICAVRDDTVPSSDPPRFLTFCRAGSGFSIENMKKLEEAIKTKDIKYDPQNVPEWLFHSPSGDLPHVLIDYKDNIVIEVKGTEIVPSDSFGVESTLRFPRLVRIRQDKRWQDIMTYSDVIKAKEEGGVGKKRAVEDRIEGTNKKFRSKRLSLLPSQVGFNSSQAERKSSLFGGKTFSIINGSVAGTESKQEFERLVAENGGRFIQKPRLADIVIAGVSDFSFKSICNNGEIDVLYPKYITDCIDSRELMLKEPKYMHYTTERTKQEFLESMDIHGDSFLKETDEKVLKETIERMGKDETETEGKRRKIAQEVIHRYFYKEMAGLLFLNVVAYFDEDTSKSTVQPKPLTLDWVAWEKQRTHINLVKRRFEFDAGKISQSIEDEEITHIVLNGNDLSRLKDLTKAFNRPKLARFVTLEWITACIENETLINELEFEPKISAVVKKSIVVSTNADEDDDTD